MQKRIKLTIEDTLSFFDDYLEDYIFNENNVKTNDYFVKVPLEWLENEQLTPVGLERFYQYLYGENWRYGNGDGSRYLPLKATVTLLGDDQKEEWMAKNHCFGANPDGTISQLSTQEF